MSAQKSLEDAFRKSLDLKSDVDLTKIAYGEIAEWDSIAHMQLVATIEETFDLMLETDDVIAMSSFTITKDILRSNYDVRFES